ncbi:MAG: ArnT family glycosyltransferase [Pseudomonadota bacterium]
MNHPLVACVIIAAAYALLLSLFWVGFLASDDAFYAFLAEKWRAGGAYLPTSHWGFRYPVILPVVAANVLFGAGATALGAVAVLYGSGLLLAIYVLIHRFFSPSKALAVTFLAMTTPIVIISASILNADIPEAFFGLISIGLFVQATQAARPAGYLVASGAMCAIACLTRETSSGLMLAYLMLFLAGAFFERKVYLWGALGFLVIFGIEAIYYMALGEGPLYRFMTIAQTHGTVKLTLEDMGGGSGNISTNRIIGPPLALLFNQEFALLYILSLPASWSLIRNQALDGAPRVLVRVLVTVMATWVLWISYSGAVPPAPRYYSLATVAAILLVALWLTHMANRKAAVVLGFLFILGNFAALSLENMHPRFAARTLADYLQTAQEPVYTDSRTYKRAMTLLRWSPGEARVWLRQGVPPAGALYFRNVDAVGTILDSDHDPSGQAFFRPAFDNPQTIVSRWTPPKRIIGHILTGLHLDQYLPARLHGKIVYCASPVDVVRIAR